MNPVRYIAIVALSLSAIAAHAKEKKWDVPCLKVFVTGVQEHEIAWALKGDGVDNNLYRTTCMQPVANASEADAVLDIEPVPEIAAAAANRIKSRENAIESGNFWVSCRSDAHGSYCLDSSGYSLQTACGDRGCSSYYGPDPGIALAHAIGDSIHTWVEQSSAWAYIFSTKDHHVIWKYEGVGPWHADLSQYSECPKKTGTYGKACKKPKELLP